MEKQVIYIDKPETTEKPIEFTYWLSKRGHEETESTPADYEKVVYLGKCHIDGDMFAAYTREGGIAIFSGHLNSGRY